MRALSAADLLRIVERSAGASPTASALAILACGCPDEPVPDLVRLPLGARDRLLLDLRQQTLGGALSALVCCPSCGAELELSLQTDALMVGECPSGTGSYALQHGALELRFRLPTSEDLLSVEDCADEEHAVRRLASRCIESAVRAGRALDPAQLATNLNDAELEALGEAMTDADPQADLRVELLCAECGDAFERELDLAAFFSAELASAAQRLFFEIDALARGYGWSESDIVSMSAWRRRVYVEMLAR
jgi:hypothetical protein